MSEMELDGIVTGIRLVAEAGREAQYYPTRETGRHSDCLVYFIAGRADYRENGVLYAIDSGDIIFLPRGSLYSMDILERQRYIYVDFDFGDDVKRTLARCPADRLAGAEAMFRRLSARFGHRGAESRAGAMSELYAIIAAANRASEREYVSESVRSLMETARGLIARRAPDADFSVETLHRELGMSEAHFRRSFRAAFGAPPSVFLAECRMNAARSLFGSTGLSVNEVAARSGYADPSYFSRAFRRAYGVTPTEYRRAVRNL